MAVRPSWPTPSGAARLPQGWSPHLGHEWWHSHRRPHSQLGGASANTTAPWDLGELTGQHGCGGASPMRSITSEAVEAALGGVAMVTTAVAAVGGSDGEVLWH
jgi:hypothetical protein